MSLFRIFLPIVLHIFLKNYYPIILILFLFSPFVFFQKYESCVTKYFCNFKLLTFARLQQKPILNDYQTPKPEETRLLKQTGEGC